MSPQQSAVDGKSGNERIYELILVNPELIMKALVAIKEYAASLPPPARLSSRDFALVVSRAVKMKARRNIGVFTSLAKAFISMGFVEAFEGSPHLGPGPDNRFVAVSPFGELLINTDTQTREACEQILVLCKANFPGYFKPPSGSS